MYGQGEVGGGWGGVGAMGRENKGLGGAGRSRGLGWVGWGVGTLVLGGPISIGVRSGGGALWLETMPGVPPALICKNDPPLPLPH